MCGQNFFQCAWLPTAMIAGMSAVLKTQNAAAARRPAAITLSKTRS